MKPSDQARWQGSVDSLLTQGWGSAGRLINPVNGTVLADTGALVAGYYDFIIFFACNTTIGMYLELQHRNSGNTVTLKFQNFAILANNSYEFYLNNYKVSPWERVRVMTTSTLGCAIQISIIHNQRA